MKKSHAMLDQGLRRRRKPNPVPQEMVIFEIRIRIGVNVNASQGPPMRQIGALSRPRPCPHWNVAPLSFKTFPSNSKLCEARGGPNPEVENVTPLINVFVWARSDDHDAGKSVGCNR